MSTELAATLLLDDIRKNVDKGQLVGAVFVDLSKAFDTISHSNLLTKLPSYGIDGFLTTYFVVVPSLLAHNGRQKAIDTQS